jgi:hypothetical protein
MLKKVKDKRIDTFKSLYPDYKISKKGNFYIGLGPTKESNRSIFNSGFNITKGTINKLGTFTSFTTSVNSVILMITQTGVLKILINNNRHAKPRFKNVTVKDIMMTQMIDGCYNIKDVFFIGRKFEYLKDYPNLYPFRIAQNFKSIKELKCFIGYDFISDREFYSLFIEPEYTFEGPLDVMRWLIYAKNKVDAYNLFKGKSRDKTSEIITLLVDTCEMCSKLNIDFNVPAGYNKLKEIHDQCIETYNQGKIEMYSTQQVYDVTVIDKPDFRDQWKESGLVFRQLVTPRELFTQGLKQKHCLGSFYDSLSTELFFSFTWGGEEYDLQIRNSGYVGQFKGRRNKNVPNELLMLILNNDINRKFNFKVHTISDPDNSYPLKINNNTSTVLEDANDWLPF